jgi:hypothetical protein
VIRLIRAQVQALPHEQDQHRDRRGQGQVQQPDQDRHRAQHPLAGQPAEAFGQFLPDPGFLLTVRRRARGSVRSADQADQHRTGRVRSRVDVERHARRQHEQEPAQRPGEHVLRQRGPADQPAVGALQAGARHHGRDHGLGRGAEDDLPGVDDEQHRVQQGDAGPSGQQRGGQDAHRDDPDPVDGDHQPPPVDPVHEHPAGQGKEQPGQPRRAGGGRHDQRAPGVRRDEQRRRDRGQAATQGRRGAGRPQLREPRAEWLLHVKRRYSSRVGRPRPRGRLFRMRVRPSIRPGCPARPRRHIAGAACRTGAWPGRRAGGVPCSPGRSDNRTTPWRL